MPDCIFCRIAGGEIPAKVRYEDDEFIAFDDIKPAAPVHILIVPKKHIASLGEATDTDALLLGKLQLVVKTIVTQVSIIQAYQVILNGGSLQEVPHMHYHLKGGFGKESETQ